MTKYCEVRVDTLINYVLKRLNVACSLAPHHLPHVEPYRQCGVHRGAGLQVDQWPRNLRLGIALRCWYAEFALLRLFLFHELTANSANGRQDVLPVTG